MRHLCRHIWCPGIFKCSLQGQNSRWKDFVLWFFAGGHTLLYLLARDVILRRWIPQNYDYQNQRADSPFFVCHFYSLMLICIHTLLLQGLHIFFNAFLAQPPSQGVYCQHTQLFWLDTPASFVSALCREVD